MIRKLIRYELDFDRALNYIKDNLSDLNALSEALLNVIDFKTGRFFTLLPNNSHLDRLYEFEAGLILPQNPEIEYFVESRKATYSIIPTIQDEVIHVLFHEIKKNNRAVCIFDDILSSPNDPYLQEEDLRDYVFFHNNEVYYSVNSLKADIDCLSKCVEQSNAIWHSLCILTTHVFINSKDVSLTQIKNMCLHTQLIVIGAYDREGYIFWEKIKK